MPMVVPALLISLQAVSPSGPFAAPAAIPLWRHFTTASTKADVKAFKAMQPNKRVEVITGCRAEMVYRQIDGHLVSIIFLGQDRDADFFARLYADYLRQYGEPERQSTTFGGTITYGTGSGITSVTSTSTGVLNVWRQGGTKIKLVKSPGNGYNLIFTVRPEKFIH